MFFLTRIFLGIEIVLIIVGIISKSEKRRTIILRTIAVLNFIPITLCLRVLLVLKPINVMIVWPGVVCVYLINIGFCLFAKKLANTKKRFIITTIILMVLMFVIPIFAISDHEHRFEEYKENKGLPRKHIGGEVIIEFDQYNNSYFLPIYKHEK